MIRRCKEATLHAVFAKDIAARKRADIEQRAVEQRLRVVTANVPIALFALDPQGIFTLSEGRVLTALGLDGTQVVGRSIFDTCKDKARILSNARRALAGEEFTEFDFVPEYDRTFVTRWAPVHDRDGVFTGCIGVAMDVSDAMTRAREPGPLERRLGDNARRLQVALESAEIGTWDFRPQTGEFYWDARCRELCGVAHDAPVNLERFVAMVHADDRAKLKDELGRSQDPADDGHYNVECRIMRASDGAERWLQAQGRCFFDSQGEPVRLTGTVLDITKRKVQEQFRERVLGIVSHDLRNPLSVITTSAGRLLRNKEISDKVRSAAGRIESSAQRMENMISDLLDFARGQVRNGIPIHRQPANLRSVVQHVVRDMRLTHPNRSIQCDGTGTFEGLWDPDRLGQVATNLLANALSHSPDDTTVQVWLRDQGDTVALCIANQSEPIPKELLARIFEPFRCGGASVGVGLGLYIVQQIAVQHGGSVDVVSDTTGTRFTVRLPRHPPQT